MAVNWKVKRKSKLCPLDVGEDDTKERAGEGEMTEKREGGVEVGRSLQSA